MPGDEAILEVGHGVAVRVLDEGHDRVRGDALPAERIVRRKPRQRTDVLYYSEAIEVLEKLEPHTCRDCNTIRPLKLGLDSHWTSGGLLG